MPKVKSTKEIKFVVHHLMHDTILKSKIVVTLEKEIKRCCTLNNGRNTRGK